MKPFDPEGGIAKSRRNLPHWEQAGCTYFLTWRLADSLPVTKLTEWTESRDRWLGLNPRPWSPATAAEYSREFVSRIEAWLDAGHGSCILARPDARHILASAMEFFHGQRYDLDACVIMPNHVHVLVTPYAERDTGFPAFAHKPAQAGKPVLHSKVKQPFLAVIETDPQAGKPVSHSLARIVQSWKGYSAREINRLVGRNGCLWMDETFDHAVRSEAQLEHFRNYIRENPAKAGLRDGEYFLRSNVTQAFQPVSETCPQAGKPVAHSGAE